MSTCLMAGAMMLTLAGDGFALEWTHSVERVIWHEDWEVRDGALVLTGAAVKGYGAGMEPAPDAVLRDGWWVWVPDLPPLPGLMMAASGATRGGWQICEQGMPGQLNGDTCTEIGADPGQPIPLTPCENDINGD